jgi:hypothetical protein
MDALGGSGVEMTTRRKFQLAMPSMFACLLAAPIAEAQDPQPPATSTAEPAPPPSAPNALPEADAPPSDSEAARKEEARVFFDKGVKLFKEGLWDAALAEFSRSREIASTRAATSNAAVCLRKLKRFDEALEMNEALLREFKDLPPEVKAKAEREIVELAALLGTIEIAGAEPGSSIVVDGRLRGEHATREPLRVSAGTHVVRIYKEGFEPFETQVRVAGGQSAKVAVKMPALARDRSGRLRVVEQGGRTLDVVVDGVVVGKTPWEGPLATGEHVIVLRGEGDLGTQPVTAPVRFDQITPLTLAAEALDASMRIEPTPGGATVAVDSVMVGRGLWTGRLRSGEHTVEVAAEGFVPIKRTLNLPKGGRETLAIELQRDLSSPLWRRPSKITLEVAAAAPLFLSFGGDVAGGCADPCSRGIGAGIQAVFHGGYELSSGVGFGVTAGYLRMQQSVTARSSSISYAAGRRNEGTADHGLTLQGALAGAWAGLSLGERFPLHLRLGVGALLGSMRDVRSGSYAASDGTKYAIGPLGASAFAGLLYVAPEVRAGYRISDRLEISAGLTGMMLVDLAQPTWDKDARVYSPDVNEGIGRFGADALTSSLSFALLPGLGARYDF